MDFLADRLRSVGGCQPNRLGGIRGGTQCVRAHMSDTRSLPRRLGGRHRRGAAHFTSGGIPDETAADQVCDAKLTTSKGPSPRDRITGASIPASLRLEQAQHPLRATRRPQRNNPPVGFAQRLGRAHTTLSPASGCGSTTAFLSFSAGDRRQGHGLRVGEGLDSREQVRATPEGHLVGCDRGCGRRERGDGAARGLRADRRPAVGGARRPRRVGRLAVPAALRLARRASRRCSGDERHGRWLLAPAGEVRATLAPLPARDARARDRLRDRRRRGPRDRLHAAARRRARRA